MNKAILVIGATSAMAKETCKHFAAEKDRFFLVARDNQKLEVVEKDLCARGAQEVKTFCCDVLDFAQHQKIVNSMLAAYGTIDIVLMAQGILPDAKKSLEDYAIVEETIKVNVLSVISLLIPIAAHMEKARSGKIAVISSVAGDRGRAASCIYATSKGALNVFLEGLWQRLQRSGVSVINIKPGYIDTPMTTHMTKGPLFAKADFAGLEIYKAIIKKKPVAYVPTFWRYIMLLIIHMPRFLFKRMKF